MIHKPFLFWCQKVLPLVYDDSLSYYELLCKVVKYLNNLIEQDKIFANEISSVKEELADLKNLIDNWNEKSDAFFNEWMQLHLANMILPEITNAGYIVYNIPKIWNRVTFNTTGLDIILEMQPEYGHLVLSY